MTQSDSGPDASGRRYGGLSEQERRDERYRRLLAAGLETFGRAGFAATTTRSLCAQAGLTQRYFYQAFNGLEALFTEVATALAERLKQNILAALQNPPADPDAITRAGLTAYFQTMQEDPRVARILLIEVFSASRQTEMLARDFMDELSNLVRITLETHYPDLLQRQLSTRLLATGLIGATHHIALRWTMSDYNEPREQVVETALQIYRNALNA